MADPVTVGKIAVKVASVVSDEEQRKKVIICVIATKSTATSCSGYDTSTSYVDSWHASYWQRPHRLWSTAEAHTYGF